MTDKERFEATARETWQAIYEKLAFMIHPSDIELHVSVISSALSAAFEDGRKAGAEQVWSAVWELSRINQELGIE